MTDNDIIKALEWWLTVANNTGSITLSKEDIFATNDLINRQKAENNDLFCKLTGVMHSVDKWLSVDELKQDEVVRAITRREKTLQIVEKLHEKIEELEEEKEMLRASKAEAVKEFATDVINDILPKYMQGHSEQALKISLAISKRAKEMVSDNNSE